jgi:hypothetical protein
MHRPREARLILPLAALAFITAAARQAEARRGTRPVFEPTDLELEETGVTEIDLQMGVIRSRGPARIVVPDFEIDLGLLPNLELDLDGAYAIEGPPAGPFAFDHAAPDSLWLSAKIGFWDWRDDDAGGAGADGATVWAVGAQAGPKLPVASGSHGLGAEALLLISHPHHRTHLVLNLGAFVDPSPDAAGGRPIGLEAGLDIVQDLDAGARYSLTGELSGVRFLSSDPAQLLATAGVAWSPRPEIQLSLIALVGFLEGSDRYGVLLGFSPKLRLFGRK